MNKKVLFLFVVLIIISASFLQQSLYQDIKAAGIITESKNMSDKIPTAYSGFKNNNQGSNGDLGIEKPKIYGTWSLDKIILSSKCYTGEKNWGDGHIFSEKTYIGSEIEYKTEYMCLDDEKFLYPTYKVSEFKFYDFNNNGDFEQPDLYEIVKTERINVDRIDKFENIGDIPLAYFLVSFEENYFIPIGNQVVLLNENTMLVGVWGDIILAHRLK